MPTPSLEWFGAMNRCRPAGSKRSWAGSVNPITVPTLGVTAADMSKPSARSASVTSTVRLALL
jgi:hypothetical protein